MIFFIVTFVSSCTLGQAGYDELMKKTQDKKINEERLGKIALSYDGYTEPPFPVAKSKDSTIYGVDSNRDGVRDDIEIWINRNAETAEIRKAFKDYYRSALLLYEAVESNQEENVYQKRFDDREVAGICLLQVSFSQNKEYQRKYGMDAGIAYSHWLDILFQDNLFRKKIYKEEQAHSMKAVLHYTEEEIVRNCEKSVGHAQYSKVRQLAKDYSKSNR